MEVLGLTMIVLLFLVGIGLLVFFGSPKGSNFTTEYNQKLVGSFVTVLPDVKIPCGGGSVRMAEFVRACATRSSIGCAGDYSQTCEMLSQAISLSLKNSLDKWGYEYNLTLSDLPIQLNNSGGVYCKGKPRKVVGEQPLPVSALGAQPVIIKLSVCY